MKEYFDNSSEPSLPNVLEKYQTMKASGEDIYFEVDELTMLAEHFADRNDNTSADEVIDYGLKLYPNNTDLLCMKCHSFIVGHQLDEAESILDLIADKQDYEPTLMQGELLLAHKKDEEAEILFDELYRKEPEVYTALDVAELYLFFDMREEAATWLAKSGPDNLKDLDRTKVYIKYYFLTEEYAKAVRCLNSQLDQEPYNLEAWQMLIRCYIFLDDAPNMQNALEFALAIDDKDPVNLELQANFYILKNDFDNALKSLKAAEEVATNKTTIYFTLMSIYNTRKEYDEVIKYSDWILKDNDLVDADLSRVYQNRANAWLHKGDYDRCMDNIKDGLMFNRKNDELLLLTGRVLLHHNRVEKAQEAFKFAQAYSKCLPYTLEAIGRHYLEEAHTDEAIAVFNKVSGFKGEEFIAAYYLAYCYYVKHQPEMVVPYLHNIKRFLPEDMDEFDISLPDTERTVSFKNLLEQILSL